MSALALLKALFKIIALPPNGPLLVMLGGLLTARWRPRTGHALAWVGLLALLLLSIPAIGDLIQEGLHPPTTAFEPADAAGARAIVILGGGARLNAPEYGGDTVARLTLERVRYGARVARLTGLPVLVSGGRPPFGRVPEAVLMRNVLQDEFHVSVRWSETESRNTHENAFNSAQILGAAGVRRVVLVSHAFDIRRASREFAAAGIEVVPAATHLAPPGPSTYVDWIPGIGGLQLSYYVLYEWFGNLALSLALRDEGPPARVQDASR